MPIVLFSCQSHKTSDFPSSLIQNIWLHDENFSPRRRAIGSREKWASAYCCSCQLKKDIKSLLLLYRATTNWNWKTQYRMPWKDIVIQHAIDFPQRETKDTAWLVFAITWYLRGTFCSRFFRKIVHQTTTLGVMDIFSVTFMCNWQMNKASLKWNFRWNISRERNSFWTLGIPWNWAWKVFHLKVFVGNIIFWGLHVSSVWLKG